MFVLEFEVPQQITGLGRINDEQHYAGKSMYRIGTKWYDAEELTEFQTDKKLQKTPIGKLIDIFRIGKFKPDGWENYATTRFVHLYHNDSDFKQRIDRLVKTKKDQIVFDSLLN